MKSVVIFILFLFLGFILFIGYSYWENEQNNFINPNSPITTTFSMNNAPSTSLKGTIATMSGTVTWLSRTAKNPVQLQSPRSIQQGETLGTGKNSNVGVLINNAAAVSLSSNSDVNFIQMLPINLVMAQDKGTATYQNTGQNAMTVTTRDLITAVNRAWAVISVDPTAQTVTVAVQKGSVTEGYEDAHDNSTVVTVGAGQQFVFDDTTQEGTTL